MEMVVILLVIVLLFGANRLPELARASGQALGEFRRGREDVEADRRAGQKGDEESTSGRTPDYPGRDRPA
jgi:sec-independent protein translocase protein TatA